MRYFVFAVRFLFLPWQLWVTINSRSRVTYAFIQARRRGEGGGGVQGVRTNPLWDVNIEVTENPKKIQKTANFITVVA